MLSVKGYCTQWAVCLSTSVGEKYCRQPLQKWTKSQTAEKIHDKRFCQYHGILPLLTGIDKTLAGVR